MNLIFDTDAGPDDLLALLYLLACPSICIEAITTSYGLANTERGAHNIRCLLSRCGRPSIPVYAGEDQPLQGSAAFPRSWRNRANRLPRITLPDLPVLSKQISAVDYLKWRTQQTAAPVSILATGALTNIGALMEDSLPSISQLIIMGGAFDVPGNVNSRGPNQSSHDAEWNIYVDPLAACKVFSSGIPNQLLIPLDATNDVPITTHFIDNFVNSGSGELYSAACDLFRMITPEVASGTYYAWDPLAAVALVEPYVLNTIKHAVAVDSKTGKTEYALSGSHKTIAVSANRSVWEQEYLKVFV